MSKYVERVIEDVKTKYANEPEFCQTVEEVLSSLGPVVDAHPALFCAQLTKIRSMDIRGRQSRL